MLAVWKLDPIFTHVRIRALETRGIAERFRISRVDFHPGSYGGQYELSLLVPDRRGTISEVQVAGPNELWVHRLDSVTLRFLPANPAIHEVMDEGLWER